MPKDSDLEFAYINYEHGGAAAGDWLGSPGEFSMDGLVELFDADGRWPDLGVIGEPERWGFDGQKGKFLAATALNEASGRGYAIELGTLPREWGPIGPAFIYDTTRVNLHRFFSGNEPDFYGRNRNLAHVSLRGRPNQRINVVGCHGDIHSPLYQYLDAQTLRRYANPAVPTVILADWNATLSGPRSEPQNFEVFDEFWQYARLVKWDPNSPHGHPYTADCTTMNYLCGRWEPNGTGGRRVGGVGFTHAAELDGVHTPTTYPKPNGRDCRQIDGAILNASAAAMLVPGSVQIHEPRDPRNAPSDHKRFSCTLDLSAAA